MSLQGSIRTKLLLVVGLFLVPLALLAWLFVQQSSKDISFAAKERDGVAYAEAVWPLLHQLVGSVDGAATRAATATAALAGFARLDATMETGEARRALETTPAVGTARILLTRIADGSNLTLDPDMDSFYVMDIVTVKLPDTAERIGSLTALLAAAKSKSTFDDDDKAELMIQVGQLGAAVSGATASLESALKGNADGLVRSRLFGPAKTFADSAEAFATAVKAAAVAFRDDDTRRGYDLAALRAQARATLASTDSYWTAGAEVLDRLLENRIDGFTGRLWSMLGLAGFVAAFAYAAILLVAFGISRRLGSLRKAMLQLADGQFDIVLPGLGRRDEIGEIAAAVETFKVRAIEKARTDAEQQEREAERGREEQRAKVEVAIEAFRSSIEDMLGSVTRSAGTMRSNAQSINTVATEASGQADAANLTSQHASGSVQTVAAASEELAVSIQEIGRQIAQATETVRAADFKTGRSVGEIEALAAMSEKIGTVVGLIQAIAAQTNLLALNATIEAARAGEAGRGFAVVAQEVKNLAAQTANATAEISNEVTAIQTSTKSAVEAVREIGTAMRDINQVTAAIASAVSQQGAATQEISQNVQIAAEGNAALAGNISNVSDAVAQASRAAGEVFSAADGLATQAARLSDEVTAFFHSLRTGVLDRRKGQDPNYAGPERRSRDGAASDQHAA